MAKYRDISPLEFSYLATDNKHGSYFVNQFIVEGQGTLTLQQLEDAVTKAARANTGIRLKLNGRWGFRYWDDEGSLPTVYESNQLWDGYSDDNAFFDKQVINCRTHPCAEVILLTTGENQKIIFRVHHAVCDGGGMMHWIEEVFRALRSESLLGSNGRLSDWTLAKQHEAPNYHLPTRNWSPVLEPQLNKALLFESHWQHFLLEDSKPKLLPRFIFVLAQLTFERVTDAYLCFRIPSDLRRLLKDDDFHMGNLTSAIDLEIKREDTVDDIYNKIIHGIRNKSDLSAFSDKLEWVRWLPKFLFNPSHKFFKKLYLNGFCNITAIISFFSRIKLSALSCENFRAMSIFAIPIPLEGVSFSCGVLQNEQNIQACISIPKSFANKEQLNLLVKELNHRLGST